MSGKRVAALFGMVILSSASAQAGGRAANEVSPGLAQLGDAPAAVAATPSPPAPALAPPVRSRRGDRPERFTGHHNEKRSRPTAEALIAALPGATLAAKASVEPVPPGAGTAVERPAEGPRAAPPIVASGPKEAGSPTVAALVAKHAQENGVPVALAQAVVRIESRGNARGALGLMQIKPQTARSVGFSGGASGLFSPDTNLRYGMKVLAAAYRSSGGDVCRALMQYQSGHLATHMTRANRVYCSKARALMAGA